MRESGEAASVRQRLLDEARARGRPFQDVLQYFAIERFLYRLSRHPCADRFILKGALLMTVWGAPAARPTFDIDLAGRTAYNVHNFSRLIRSLCRMRSTEDAITFHADFVDVAKLGIDGQYEGVRGRFRAELAGDPVPMQVDLTYDNLIVPGPLAVTYPVILDFPAPVLLAYPREAVVAEKLSALVTRGLLTGRLKDYYDLWLMSRLHPFDGARLAAAIRAIFEHRGTEIRRIPPVWRNTSAPTGHEPRNGARYGSGADSTAHPKPCWRPFDHLGSFSIRRSPRSTKGGPSPSTGSPADLGCDRRGRRRSAAPKPVVR